MWIAKPSELRRTAVLNARVRPDLKAWLSERARAEKRSVADIVEGLLEAASKAPQAVPPASAKR